MSGQYGLRYEHITAPLFAVSGCRNTAVHAHGAGAPRRKPGSAGRAESVRNSLVHNAQGKPVGRPAADRGGSSPSNQPTNQPKTPPTKTVSGVSVAGYGLPAPFLVGSTGTYDWPSLGVGGRVLPRTAVRSSPVFPPRGPTITYCPDKGAFCPGLKLGTIMVSSLLPSIFLPDGQPWTCA
jgi:hypothetical protein